jgi:signal peptidase I
MTIENAYGFFAFDVVTYLAIFIVLTFVIIVIDKFFIDKSEENITEIQTQKTWKNWLYFLAFGRFNKNQKYKHRPKIVQWSAEFFPVLLLVFLIRGFIAEPFRIPSNSMMPTLLTGDFVFVNKMSYGVRLPLTNTKIFETGDVQRGDVAVFRYPNYEKDERFKGADFIKRVIGLPGDRVEYFDDKLAINGEVVGTQILGFYSSDKTSAIKEQGYVDSLEKINNNPHRILLHPQVPSKGIDIVVPNGHYLVMGDNRSNSADSRYWGFVPDEYLLGEAVLVWMYYDEGFDFSRLGLIE